ncbi:MAG: sensor histidine kinase [Bacillota bacterium]|nr:sensor histidine kinase [Bacillota bacterium]
MNKVRDNFAFKVVIYILMIAMMLVTALMAMATAVNVGYEWYSKSENQVKENIYEETLDYTASVLSNNLDFARGLVSDGEEVFSEDPELELIIGESGAANFGYTVYAENPEDWGYDGAAGSIVREMNPEVKSLEDVHTESFSFHVEDEREGRTEAVGYVIEMYVGDLESGGAPDEVCSIYNLFTYIYDLRITALVSAVIGFLISLGLFIFLMTVAGKRKKENALIPRLPMDLMALAAVLLLVFVGAALMSAGFYETNYDAEIALFSISIVVIAAVSTGFLLMLAVQIKAGDWLQRTLIYQIFRGLSWIMKKFSAFLRHIPVVWKTSVALAVGLFINLMILFVAAAHMYNGAIAGLLWIIGAAVTSALVIHVAVCLRRLKEAGRHLAEGDFDYQVDKKGMYLDLAEHADNLNSIGAGMAKTVEERMKSERFKTELITNVSHDIKTPLTSIINYADFLKQEDLDNEKAKEYIRVIDRQAQRLKRLTEDVVDASKAATGNVKMEMAPCQAGVLMTQVMGEYKEKAEAEDLELILDLPEKDTEILADGRRLWRVFDNLLNNICKYSQPGTRVYQTLAIADGKAVITYKNTSKYQLNITEEELMERFTRGDRSRHTEGSGLGLSIARNLVELQKGKFEIEIDGDLFKVICTFDTLE